MAFRIPTSDVSVVDATVDLKREATYEQICDAMKEEASETNLEIVLGYTKPLVATDFRI